LKKPNPFLLLFILLLIPFSVYFVRPDLIGNDGYGFLLFVCTGENIVGLAGVPLAIFSSFTCNLLAIKAVLFALAFISGCFILKFCEVFTDEWDKAAYIIFLSSVFVLEFVKFENDQFAYPFLFASLYYFFKGMTYGRRKSFAKSLILLGVAGLIWQGSIFYLFAYSFNAVALAVVSLPIILWKRAEIVGAILRTFQIAEDMPMQFHLHFILNFGLFGAILEPILAYQALFLFGLGAFSAKFWILSLPFLVVGMILLLKRLEGLPHLKWFNVQTFAMVLAAFCLLGVAQSVWLNQPTESDWRALEFSQGLEEDVEVDWSMGYWARWYGIQTESYGSFHRQTDFNGIAVTRQDLNCPTLKAFGEVRVVRC